MRVKEVPDLDDEWVKSLGEDIETVEALRERIRNTLSEQTRFESDQRLRESAMNQLIDAHPVEVPETLLQHQTQRLLESSVRDLIARGVDPRNKEINWESLRDLLKLQAERNLQGSLLLDSIAEQENIAVTDEEIEKEIASFAEASRQTVDEVRTALTKQGGNRSIADRLRQRKALDLIVETARVTEEEWREKEKASGQASVEQATAGATDQAEAPKGEETRGLEHPGSEG